MSIAAPTAEEIRAASRCITSQFSPDEMLTDGWGGMTAVVRKSCGPLLQALSETVSERDLPLRVTMEAALTAGIRLGLEIAAKRGQEEVQ